MSVQNRIKSLKSKHEELVLKIETEDGKSSRDENLIHDLKRQKLRLKDEISALII